MMAISFSLRALAFCFVILCGTTLCLASRQSFSGQQGQFGECNIQNLNPLEPSHKIQHEAGISEVWDENNQQLKCAGVSVTRHVIENKGLLLPSFNNAPIIFFVLQGRGSLGVMFPGCPETYQSTQQSKQETGEEGQRQPQGQRFQDHHQKIHRLRQGDVVALPVGVAHWAYNEGTNEQDKLVLLVVHDISNKANQLDQNLRRFFIAGNQQEQQGQGGSQSKGSNWNNVFQELDTQLLAQAFRVKTETINKLKSQKNKRGFIVRVQNGLSFVRPGSQWEQGQGGRHGTGDNGVEETVCTLRLRENLADPERADVYTARGGSVSTVNSYNLPILRHLDLSAGRGTLRPNAMIAPYWNVNAHSISYVTRGSGRLQVVGNSKKLVYDGEVRQGQLFIVPQNFVHLKQAGNQGLEWVTVKTNDQAKSSALVGRTSVIRGMPIDVLINAYQLSRQEAEAIKYNREEITVLSPQFSGSQSQEERSPWSIVWPK